MRPHIVSWYDSDDNERHAVGPFESLDSAEAFVSEHVLPNRNSVDGRAVELLTDDEWIAGREREAVLA